MADRRRALPPQAPRAWYERFRDFLIEKGFKIGQVDTTLFIKKMDDDLFVCQVYVYDIIFGSTNEEYCKEFGKMMAKEFEMSMICELTFFLGNLNKGHLSIKKCTQEIYSKDSRWMIASQLTPPMSTNTKLDIDESGIKVDQTLYRFMIADPKETHLSAVKRILRYLKHTPSIGLWYPKGVSFELLGYSDSDFAGRQVERKSTSGGCYLLGRSLVSWLSKKQKCVSLSTAEAEYIAAGFCCAQILYIKQMLLDYGVKLSRVPLLCDNKRDIRHHFIRDHIAKGDIQLRKVGTKEQLVDTFTKHLDESTFHRLRSELNVLDARSIM
ncbi:hypothetical protein U9M48_028125 [Paspalum notatum var. saurae]|uniref:Reverse transcriptase Ty1/copia-type domain-containing protein n=1 Tax=Paspalum notatum var. saurae TaxID=547442 RepID=A0AAQ3X007_PASNO